MTGQRLSVGCCAASEGLAVLQATPGLDFIELPVARSLMVGDGEFEALALWLQGSPVPARAANVFLPGDLRVVGPEADSDRLLEYATKALERATRLGVELLVFGSGASRKVPDGFSRERALDQFEAAVRLVQEQALARGVTLAVEPLHTEETNLLNTVGEAADFLRQRSLDGVRLVADLWHMQCEGEDLEALDGAGDLVAHAHVAAAERRAPGQAEDRIEDFLRRLREAGYAGGCSIECRWGDFAAEAAPAVARVHEAAVAAGWPAS